MRRTNGGNAAPDRNGHAIKTGFCWSHFRGALHPAYRRAGLPTTSSLVESLVGQVNARVKSKQKYWNRGTAAEAMLQLRAALLSEDGRLDRYLKERPGSPYRRRPNQGNHTAPGQGATSQTG